MDKRYWWIAFGVLCGLAAAGLILLVAGPRRGKPIELLPPPTAEPILVHVSGAVESPGLYALPLGSRAQDAIEAAGGASTEADLDGINLARVLVDGQQIRVPVLGEADGEEIRFPLNINFATVEELSQLPGIGPVSALAIVNYRESHGAFNAIEEIQKVSGIGPSTFEAIKDLISIDG